MSKVNSKQCVRSISRIMTQTLLEMTPSKTDFYHFRRDGLCILLTLSKEATLLRDSHSSTATLESLMKAMC